MSVVLEVPDKENTEVNEKEMNQQTPASARRSVNHTRFDEDNVIRIFKWSVCRDEEWSEHEEKVDSEMEKCELLKDLVKVLAAVKR